MFRDFPACRVGLPVFGSTKVLDKWSCSWASLMISTEPKKSWRLYLVVRKSLGIGWRQKLQEVPEKDIVTVISAILFLKPTQGRSKLNISMGQNLGPGFENLTSFGFWHPSLGLQNLQPWHPWHRATQYSQWRCRRAHSSCTPLARNTPGEDQTKMGPQNVNRCWDPILSSHFWWLCYVVQSRWVCLRLNATLNVEWDFGPHDGMVSY